MQYSKEHRILDICLWFIRFHIDVQIVIYLIEFRADTHSDWRSNTKDQFDTKEFINKMVYLLKFTMD